MTDECDAVDLASMPKGVEHPPMAVGGEPSWPLPVDLASMPKGVEHESGEWVHGTPRSLVDLASMPKGVEHTPREMSALQGYPR